MIYAHLCPCDQHWSISFVSIRFCMWESRILSPRWVCNFKWMLCSERSHTKSPESTLKTQEPVWLTISATWEMSIPFGKTTFWCWLSMAACPSWTALQWPCEAMDSCCHPCAPGKLPLHAIGIPNLELKCCWFLLMKRLLQNNYGFTDPRIIPDLYGLLLKQMEEGYVKNIEICPTKLPGCFSIFVEKPCGISGILSPRIPQWALKWWGQ